MNEKRKLDSTILREYDIRGIVDETLSADDVRLIGRAFGSIIIEQARPNSTQSVVVGYDGRLSSVLFSSSMRAGLEEAGVDVLNIGCGPTPMLYFAAHEFSANAGVMITGSHNPSNYNGIKMVLAGRPFFGADIQRLGRRIELRNFHEGFGKTRVRNVKASYIKRLLRDFSGRKKLNVAWDPGNGSSGQIVEELVKSLPGKHFLINQNIDGNFPAHHPDPTIESNLEQLKELVIKNSCDLGFGFDGDGDRIGVIDSKGRILWGDQLMIFFARDVLKFNPGAPIITEVKASRVFFDEVTKAGGVPIMWAAGHSLIKSKMLELKAPLAGEMSGHIFFADKYYGYDDAIYAAIRLLAILSESDKTLTEMHDDLPKMLNTPELRIACPEERKFDVVKEIESRLRSEDDITISTIDGVRVESKDGWWLVRASNTQAVLVARCESNTEFGLSALKKQIRNQLSASAIELPFDLI